MKLSATQWLNVAAFALSSLAIGAWWQELLAPNTATVVAHGITWAVTVINFISAGAAVTAPPAA
jgi:hypothetical protein